MIFNFICFYEVDANIINFQQVFNCFLPRHPNNRFNPIKIEVNFSINRRYSNQSTVTWTKGCYANDRKHALDIGIKHL